MKEIYQDLIDKYLLNRMSVEERQDFEKKVSADSELKEQLAFTRQVQASIRSRNEKMAFIKKWDNEKVQQEAASHTHKRLVYWLTSIAAVLIVGFFAVRPYMSPSIKLNFDVASGDLNLRGGSNYEDIAKLIKLEQYEKAVETIAIQAQELQEELHTLTESPDIDPEQRDYDRQVINAQLQTLQWLKAQALYQSGKKAETLEVLNTLRNTQGTYQAIADSFYHLLK